MTGPVLTHQQRAERAAQRDADGDGLAAHARRHFDAGDYQAATNLIDRAEVANPTQADKWDRIRSVIDHARETTPSADTAAGERDQQLSAGQDQVERGLQDADRAHHVVEPAAEEPDRVGLGSGAVERARAAITRRNTERSSLDDADFERRSAAEPDPGIAPQHQIERD